MRLLKPLNDFIDHETFDEVIKSQNRRLITANDIKDFIESDDEWEGQEENV